RDDALEVQVFDGMVLDVHGGALHPGIERRSLGDSPARQHAADFKSDVIMKPSRPVQLDDEPGSAPLLALTVWFWHTGWFRRAGATSRCWGRRGPARPPAWCAAGIRCQRSSGCPPKRPVRSARPAGCCGCEYGSRTPTAAWTREGIARRRSAAR